MGMMLRPVSGHAPQAMCPLCESALPSPLRQGGFAKALDRGDYNIAQAGYFVQFICSSAIVGRIDSCLMKTH